jgi:glutaredoxin 3
MTLELYVTQVCPYSAELRAELEWGGTPFLEYDVERDPLARDRLFALVRGPVSVPVLVEDGRVVQVGWQGRGCYVAAERP